MSPVNRAGSVSEISPRLSLNRKNFAPSLKKIFNKPIKIYATPNSFFKAKIREIFQKTKIRHNSASEAKRWLGGLHMNYWPQQLNFAVFCATQGCEI